MVLEILLSILILCILSGGILVYLWWKKYGKKVFGLMDTLSSFKNKGITKTTEIPKIDKESIKNSLNTLNDLMGKLNNINRRQKQ